MNIVWGFVLILLGGFFLAERVDLIDNVSPTTWTLLFAVVSVLFFASYFLSGITHWGWLFPATISGGIAVIIWLATNGFDGPYLGTLILGCVSLPFWVAFLVDRKDNWWALIPGWVTAMIAAITLLSEIISGELMASFILFGVALPFFVVYALNRTHWWALIPGGIVASVGLMLLFLAPINRSGLSDELFVAIMFAGIALTFLILWTQRGKARTEWAIYPALMFAAFALLTALKIYYVWPLALILFGAWLLLGTRTRPTAEVERITK
jgi:hypothetical protein